MILDTNALSAFMDGDRKVGQILRHQPTAAIPVIVLGELRYGIAASRHRARYEQWLDRHLDAFDILRVTEVTARVYAIVRREIKDAGHPIPANDAWIAALAREHGLAVLSRDEHFRAVPDLRAVDW